MKGNIKETYLSVECDAIDLVFKSESSTIKIEDVDFDEFLDELNGAGVLRDYMIERNYIEENLDELEEWGLLKCIK